MRNKDSMFKIHSKVQIKEYNLKGEGKKSETGNNGWRQESLESG